MRKVIFYAIGLIAGSLILGSCQTYQLTDRQEETKTFAIDFREYADKGFLFMPDEYYGEYEVKGIIRAELHPSVSYKDGAVPDGEGYTIHQFFSGDQRVTQLTGDVNIDELIEHIYEVAIDWGGDAFTHFETSIETDSTDDDPNTSYAYYSISGIVIERK